MTTERVEVLITERGGPVVKRTMDEIGRGAVSAQKNVDLLSRAFRSLVGLLSIREFTRMSDVYTNMSNRLKLVAGDTANLTRLTKELFDVARDTRTSFEATATLYARVALSTKQLGYAQQELISFVKGVNQAVQLSGVTAQEAQAAMIQFSQGLAKGRLDGDELRSVLEQIPFVADVIAQKLGINRYEMKEWGKQGKLTANVIIEAFQDMEGNLTEMFAKLTPTFSQAWQVIRDQIMRTMGPATEQIGQGLALALAFATDNLDLFTTGVAALIPLMAVLAGRAAIGAVITSLNLLRVALLRNPITAIAVGIAGAIVAFGQLTDKMDGVLEAAGRQITFIDKLVATWEGTKAYIKSAWDDFPAWFANMTIQAVNLAITQIEWFAGKAVQVMNSLAGKEVFTLPDSGFLGRIDELEIPKQAGERAASAFMQAYSQTLMDRSKEIGELLPGGKKNPIIPDDDKKGKRKSFAQIVAELDKEILLMSRMGKERQRLIELGSIEEKMKRSLTQAEGALLEGMLETLQVLERQGELYDEIVGPMENFELSNRALNELFRDGHINLDQYNQKLRELQIGLLETDQTVQGGFLRGILKIQDEFSNLSTITENLVVNAMQEAEDAFIRFARTGKLSFKDMVDSVLNEIIRLNVRQNITMPLNNMLGEAFGVSNSAQSGTSGSNGGNLNFGSGSASLLGSGAEWLGQKVGSEVLSNFAAGVKGATLAPGLAGPTTQGATGAMGVGNWVGSNAGSIMGYAGSIMAAVQGQYGTAIGSAIGTYILPGIGTAIGGMIGGLADGFFGGGPPKTRHGQRATTELQDGVFSITQRDDRQAAGSDEAARQFAQASVQTANALFKQMGLDSAIESFYAIMESSVLGDRNGVASGGSIRIGDQVRNFGVPQASDMTLGGFGGWSEEDMLSRLSADIQMSVLEAFQLQIDSLPKVMGDMIRGVDIRALGAEDVVNLIMAFQTMIMEVSELQAALNLLPFANLRDTSFDAAANLLQFVGGLENAKAGLTSYFNNFYTEQEKLDLSLQELTSAFQSVGLELPDVNQGAKAAKASFRELFESLDPETNAQTIALMLGANQQFSDLVTGLEDLNGVLDETNTKIWSTADILQQRLNLEGQLLQLQGNTTEIRRRELEAIHESNRALQLHIWALQDQAAAWNTAVADGEAAFGRLSSAISAEKTRLQKEAQAISSALRDAISTSSKAVSELNNLTGKLSSTISSLVETAFGDDRNRNWAQNVITQALQSAKATGLLPQGDSFESALELVAKPSEELFDSFEAYQLDFLKTAHILNELNGVAEGQLSTEKRALKSLEDQLLLSEEWYRAELERLDELLESERIRLDLAKGTYETLLTIPDAIAGVTAAIGNIKLTLPPTVTPNPGVGGGTGTYTPVPGTNIGSSSWTTDYFLANPDVLMGYDVSSGMTPEGWAQYHWDTYGKNEGRTFANGGLYPGGLALVGERGPELINFNRAGWVHTAGQTDTLLRNAGMGTDNTQLNTLVKEITQLRQAYEMALPLWREMADYAERSADSTERIADGDAVVTTQVKGTVPTIIIEDRSTP